MSADATSSRSFAGRRERGHSPASAPRWLREAASAASSGTRRGLWAEGGLIVVVLISLVGMRSALGPWQSGDFTYYLSHWFDFLRLKGFHGLGQAFANYNMPYLYLLYIGSLITPDALAAVKVISGLSDLAMALGCYAVLRRFELRRELAAVGAVAVLLLPEVLFNSAAWGQADSTYTAFLVWALWAGLGERSRMMWVLYAFAFTFKLQAAFVLPAFVVLHVTRRWGLRGPLLGIGAVLLTEVPALIAGRSPSSLIAIYVDQASAPLPLTLNAATVYALLPEGAHDVLKSAGMYFALASVALLSYVVLRAARRRALTPPDIVLFVAALALLAPYTLPMMHERYFYVAGVLLFIYALRHRRMLPWALIAQVTALCAYTPFLFQLTSPIPLNLLALIQGAVLVVVVRELLRTTRAAGSIAVHAPGGRQHRSAGETNPA